MQDFGFRFPICLYFAVAQQKVQGREQQHLPRRSKSPLCVALVYTGSIYEAGRGMRDISDDLLECERLALFLPMSCDVTRWAILMRNWNEGKQKKRGTVNYLGDWDQQRRRPGRTDRIAQGFHGRWWQKNKRRPWEFHTVAGVPFAGAQALSRVCLLPNNNEMKDIKKNPTKIEPNLVHQWPIFKFKIRCLTFPEGIRIRLLTILVVICSVQRLAKRMQSKIGYF